ncbi:MAG: RsmD family RNA methyltransferase [Capnocytophaga sp.]|nr:RsmD family RNA methyltransferase [Capnocytophaga sp.]
MRIILGKNKGKRLVAPASLPVRPTTDFAKEALFNIINNYFYFEEISVLDLFSGTGNISYEFASRGCTDITSVDAHAGCVRFIQKTANELAYPLQVIKSDVFDFLQKTTRTYDFIFADPPYEIPLEDFQKIIQIVFERNLLTEDGILVVEHSSRVDLSENQYFESSRKYGGNMFSFFSFLEEE